MARTLNAFRLDVWTARSVYPIMGFTLVVSCAIGWLNKRPEVTGFVIMVFAMFLGGTVFQIHEKNQSAKLYGFLPLRRREVVVGRYLFALVVGLVNLVVAAGAAQLMNKIASADMTAANYLMTLVGAWLFYCFAVCVTYPIYFSVGFSKAYMFTMFPFMIVMVVLLIFLRRGGLKMLRSWVSFLDDHKIVMTCVGVGAGLVLMAVSGVVAATLYQRKELA